MLVPPIFMSMRLLQILVFLDLLIEHLQTIRDTLRAIERESNREWKLILVSEANGRERRPSSGAAIRTTAERDGSHQIRILRHIYGKVWRATLQFNDHFGGSILLLLLYYWLDIFTVVYFIFVILVGIYKQPMFRKYANAAARSSAMRAYTHIHIHTYMSFFICV